MIRRVEVAPCYVRGVARSREDFVQAGVLLVQEQGFGALTSRSLGEAMGIHSTAIYRHFPQWDQLVLAVTDAIVGGLLAEGSAAIISVSDPRERILAAMVAVRRLAHAHPDLVDNLLRLAAAPITTATPVIDELSRTVIDSLRELGLRGERLAVGYQALEGFTVGAAALDFSGHPHHLENRLGRRRSAGNAAMLEAVQSTDDVDRVNETAFLFGAHALVEAVAASAREVCDPSD